MYAPRDGESRLCNQDREKMERQDYSERKERNNGSDISVTRYRDGSSTVHWGGPCGSTNYDEFGEEC